MSIYQSLNQKTKTKINMIIKENNTLKNKINFYQAQEKLYKSSIAKIKKLYSECQITFIKTLNDYKAHENKVKKTYINYQKLLEKHYKSNENRFIEENNYLNLELRKKNNIIKYLNKKIDILNEKLNKIKFDCHYKNKKLEDEIVSKDRRLNELNESMILLAKDTNDEIKLLRDEFNIYKIEKIKNKDRKTEGNKEDLPKDNGYNKINNLNINDNKNKSLDKKEFNNEEINTLKNKIYLLEYQNKTLNQKLKRKEEELSICNNLKNELLYNNSLNNFCSSIDKENNEINLLKFQNLEKMLQNYGNKINHLKNQFNESLIRHQEEIQEIKNNYEKNNDNRDNNSNIDINKGNEQDNNDYYNNYDDDNINNFNNEYYNNYDINEFQITNNVNKSQLENYNELQINKSFNSDEGIKDEYINSKLAKINTLD